MESFSLRSRWPVNARMIQNFHLVWLDGSIDEINNDDYRNCVTQLQQVISIVDTFIDLDQCIDFITDIKEQKTFMIVSGDFSQTIVPIVQEIPQVNSVYIFCGTKPCNEQWAKQWTKVKGIYTDITSIYESLKQAAQNCDRNSVSISFVKMTDDTSTQKLDTLDKSFMYTQILKEILLTIDFEQSHINEFLTYCRQQLVGNTTALKNVDKIEKEYHHHEPIWWYTYDYVLYSMVNRALRLMEVDLIIKMGFFVRDLHKHIAELHAQQYDGQNHLNLFTVHRGQGLSQTDFDQLMKTKGGLMSFNNFLSTSLDRVVSRSFAESNQDNPDLIGVLFEITVNPSISSSLFANLKNASYYEEEEEILFSMHSIFRIGQIEQIDGNTRLWVVDLILTSDNDPQLNALTERMREETRGFTGWDRLGRLMIKLGQSNNAEKLYEILLKQATSQIEKGYLFQRLGQTNFLQGDYAETVTYFEKSIKIFQQTLPANHPEFPAVYSNIGLVYYSMSEYSKAFSYYDKALEIQQKTLPEYHPDLATSHNNIGGVYDNMGEYSKALSSHEKALEIRQKTLPVNHPSLATSYNNIGNVYNNMGEYSKALSSHEKAFEIRRKTLPVNHPSLATSYNNIGSVYCNMGYYSKALSYYERALDILQRSLPPNHPNIKTTKKSIEIVKKNFK